MPAGIQSTPAPLQGMVYRAASRELNRLGHECHQVMNLMIRNQVTPDQWPKLSGNIGRQLRATMDALD